VGGGGGSRLPLLAHEPSTAARWWGRSDGRRRARKTDTPRDGTTRLANVSDRYYRAPDNFRDFRRDDDGRTDGRDLCRGCFPPARPKTSSNAVGRRDERSDCRVVQRSFRSRTGSPSGRSFRLRERFLETCETASVVVLCAAYKSRRSWCVRAYVHDEGQTKDVAGTVRAARADAVATTVAIRRQRQRLSSVIAVRRRTAPV